ncbi:hypothetical protein psyc5s11_20750 [Clostridium gelidum]|uniref:Uncharacterized protein n=1 Tax=Clostridium gelidum TaxID=704125 RepID=A0ABN6IX48_9CLOT|nr:hypothetical protein [Clostridium gelidum]BCZ46008.1 hypothetical protein psyc5s11_20750 [Clostridium gelidum]
MKDDNTLFDDLIKSLENNKEVQISEEKRLDVVITYNEMKYIDDKNLWTIVL